MAMGRRIFGSATWAEAVDVDPVSVGEQLNACDEYGGPVCVWARSCRVKPLVAVGAWGRVG